VKNLALLICSLAFGLLLAEGIVRGAGLGRTFLTRGALHEYDARAGWKCKSNLDANYALPRSFDVRVRCNADGLRGEELPRPKPAERHRIAVLGDSFMWGYGVENDEVFAHVLSQQLPGSDSMNLAANGYSTVQSLVRLEDSHPSYEPDAVVLAFFWNDLEDNFDDKRGGRPVVGFTEGGAIRIDNLPVRRPWKSPSKQWFRHHSRLFGFLEYTTKLIGELTKSWRRAPRADRDALPGDFDPGAMEFTEWDVYAPPTPEIDRAWQALRELIRRIDAASGELLVVFVPSKKAMDPRQFRELFGEGPGLDWNRPATRLAEICRSLDIDFLDLNPVFREHEDPASLFLVNDGHWNAAGHALAARVAAERIAAGRDREQRYRGVGSPAS
jgi:lysophospholipase L1-like esterase